MPRQFSLAVSQTVPIAAPVQVHFRHNHRTPLFSLDKRLAIVVVDRSERPVVGDVFVGAADQIDMVLAGSCRCQAGVAAPNRPGYHLRSTVRELAGDLREEPVVTDHHSELSEPCLENRVIAARRAACFNLAPVQTGFTVLSYELAVRA